MVTEFGIRKKRNLILIVPANADNPVPEPGRQPITSDVDDASADHDRYLYS